MKTVRLKWAIMCVVFALVQIAAIIFSANLWYGNSSLPKMASIPVLLIGAIFMVMTMYCGCMAVPQRKKGMGVPSAVPTPEPVPPPSNPEPVYEPAPKEPHIVSPPPADLDEPVDDETVCIFDKTELISPAERKTLSLTLKQENAEDLVIEVKSFPVGVGRSEPSDIIVPVKSVSRRHAVLERDGDNIYITDAGSKNGTGLDGESITDRTELHSGQILTLGKAKLSVEIR